MRSVTGGTWEGVAGGRRKVLGCGQRTKELRGWSSALPQEVEGRDVKRGLTHILDSLAQPPAMLRTLTLIGEGKLHTALEGFAALHVAFTAVLGASRREILLNDCEEIGWEASGRLCGIKRVT